jgi:general secretion pathway protein E
MDDVLALDPERRRVSEAIEDLSIKSISEGTSPVVKLVHSTIYDAFKLGASDIHLEAGTSDLTVKYRIDGVLLKVKVVEGKEMAEQAISRIKVMSELDISERRIPQDGRFKLAVLGRAVDFRVSVMPSIHGEDSVIRILDKQSLSQQSQGLRLDMIGFDEQTVTQIRGLASEPYGLMLVTGPTGSGKTTSLYAVLNELNQGKDKIITIEDPVEYQLPGILQIPVNEKKGLTFSRGLRSILRHDPDKIMVGEIRDSETAQIAVQSALTGHLVLATVHANNVLDIIGRFIHMGVEPYNFVSALNGVIAQRLLRILCPHCIEPYHPDGKLLAASRLADAEAANFTFRTGRGCKDCYGTGYKGRRAIAEVLLLTDEIREQIIAKEPIRRIKDTARATGTRFLRDSAMDLVRQGITTLEEINRVTFVG